MKQTSVRIFYRLPIGIYLVLAICGFIFPIGIGITYSAKNNINNVIIGLVIAFVPYIILGTLFVAITSFLKLRHTSKVRRKIALIGAIICMFIVIWSIVSLLHYTSLRWQGTYPDLPSMDGGPEWIAAWLGGSASGLLVLFLGYLTLSRHLLSPHSE